MPGALKVRVGTEWKNTGGGGGTSGVSSVNTRTGAVVLAKGDVALANVDNTSDASKPVSSATQTALNTKAATSHAHAAGDITSGTMAIARLGSSGTPSSSTYFRGDNTWAAVSGGSTNVDPGTSGVTGQSLQRGVSGPVWAHQPANVMAYGAIADGASHPLSERYTTLAAAQAVYPHAIALTDEIDWAAIQAAINANNAVNLPWTSGWYVTNRSLTFPRDTMAIQGGVGGLTHNFATLGVRLQCNANVPVFNLGTARRMGISITGLTIRGTDQSGSRGLYGANVGFLTMENCFFDWFGDQAIRIDSGESIMLRNCHAVNTVMVATGRTGYIGGIEMDGSDHMVTGCSSSAGHFSQTGRTANGYFVGFNVIGQGGFLPIVTGTILMWGGACMVTTISPPVAPIRRGGTGGSSRARTVTSSIANRRTSTRTARHSTCTTDSTAPPPRATTRSSGVGPGWATPVTRFGMDFTTTTGTGPAAKTGTPIAPAEGTLARDSTSGILERRTIMQASRMAISPSAAADGIPVISSWGRTDSGSTAPGNCESRPVRQRAISMASSSGRKRRWLFTGSVSTAQGRTVSAKLIHHCPCRRIHRPR